MKLCAARWCHLASTSGVEVRTAVADAGRLDADPDLLVRVLDNLIDNSLRHAEGATWLEMAAAEDTSMQRHRPGARGRLTLAAAASGARFTRNLPARPAPA